MPFEIIEKPSSPSNYSNEDILPRFIIIHCIGYEKDRALNILTKPLSEGGGGVSAHFFIPQLKEPSNPYPIYRLVPETKKAYHAGLSRWRGDTSLNACSIGIEFHSPNYANALQGGEDALDWFHFEQFEEEQIKAGVELILGLMKKYNIKSENILGHSDIAPYRGNLETEIVLGKTDPGATFPWEELARRGIGVWPKNYRTRSGELDTSLNNVQTLLAAYGYPVPKTGILDLITQHTIKAFQMHFMPEQSDGDVLRRMVIYLENLIDHQLKYSGDQYYPVTNQDICPAHALAPAFALYKNGVPSALNLIDDLIAEVETLGFQTK